MLSADVLSLEEELSVPRWSGSYSLGMSEALSLNDRKDRRAQSGVRAKLRSDGRAIAFGGRRLGLERGRLLIAFSFPDNRRRDLHNYAPTFKPLIDGFIDAGLLPDDDAEHLVGPDLRVSGVRSKPRLGQPVLTLDFVLYSREESK